MQAVRFVGVGKDAEIEDVAKPTPGAGQVLIKVGGAGVCHSDLHVMEEDLGFRPPFTLGHENAGWVAELGAGVRGFKEGDAVPDRLCPLHKGSIRQRITRTVEGWVAELGRRVKGIFR